MPKVLRIINRFNLGGPTYNVAYLTKFMAPEFETLLVGGMKDETEDSSLFITEKLGLKPKMIGSMQREINLANDLKAYKELKKIIVDFKPDIVHTHASKAGTLGRLAAYHANVPIIVHTFHGHVFHSYFGNLKTNFYKAIERYLAKRTSCIVAISEKQKQELAVDHKIAKPQKFRVIPLGFDLSRFVANQQDKRNSFRNQFKLDNETVAIGIIGRLVPIKNHELFLRSFEYVLDNTTQKVKAFIIGDGELYKQLKLAATRIGLGYNEKDKYHFLKHLFFTSWMHDVDVAYAGLDVVALTSLNEGTPVSLIEAQAAGKPVVSTNVGGIKNIIEHKKTGFLHEVADEEGFKNSLLNLVTNQPLREKMGKEGREDILEKYSYNRLVKDMGELYKDLLNQKNT